MSTPGGSVKTPVGEAPVVPLFLIGTGMYLAWFGVHYWRSDVKYPTDPIKDVLQGKPLPARTQTPTPDEQAVLNAAKVTPAQGQAIAQGQSVVGATPGVSSAGASSATAQQNQNTGKLLAAAYGWNTGTQWSDLVSLWNQESGWNNVAENPTSHAYGIPQALPWTKMPQAAWPPRAGGRADPTAQIGWGLSYIKSTYGSPSGAWAHEQANNWY